MTGKLVLLIFTINVCSTLYKHFQWTLLWYPSDSPSRLQFLFFHSLSTKYEDNGYT